MTTHRWSGKYRFFDIPDARLGAKYRKGARRSVWLGPLGIIIRRAIPKLILFRCEPGIGERIVGKFSRSSSRERPVVAPVRAKARDKQRDAMEPFRQFHRDARVEKSLRRLSEESKLFFGLSRNESDIPTPVLPRNDSYLKYCDAL